MVKPDLPYIPDVSDYMSGVGKKPSNPVGPPTDTSKGLSHFMHKKAEDMGIDVEGDRTPKSILDEASKLTGVKNFRTHEYEMFRKHNELGLDLDKKGQKVFFKDVLMRVDRIHPDTGNIILINGEGITFSIGPRDTRLRRFNKE